MLSSRSGALWAFLLCSAARSAYSQFVPQNGLLYWCSLSENGSNMASLSVPSAPRTTWLSYTTGSYSRMCHYQFIQSSNQPYTFSNGSSYPQNNDGQIYATNPNACMVRIIYRTGMEHIKYPQAYILARYEASIPPHTHGMNIHAHIDHCALNPSHDSFRHADGGQLGDRCQPVHGARVR